MVINAVRCIIFIKNVRNYSVYQFNNPGQYPISDTSQNANYLINNTSTLLCSKQNIWILSRNTILSQ